MAELQLEIKLPDGKRLVVPLDRARTLRLGSHRDCEVPLPFEGVQPLHCGVRWHKERFELIAAKQVQTVELNGKPVASAPLAAGDRFTVGSVNIRVVAPAASGLELAPLEDLPAHQQAATATSAAETARAPAAPLAERSAAGTTSKSDSQLGLAPLVEPAHPPAQQPRKDIPTRPAEPVATAAASERELLLAPLDELEAKASPPKTQPSPTTPAPAQRAPSSASQAATGRAVPPTPSGTPKWSPSPPPTALSKGGKAKGEPADVPAAQSVAGPIDPATTGQAGTSTAKPRPPVDPAASAPTTGAAKGGVPALPGAKEQPHAPKTAASEQPSGKPKAGVPTGGPLPQSPARLSSATSAIDALFDDALPAEADLSSLSFDEPSSPSASPRQEPPVSGADPLASMSATAERQGLQPRPGKALPRRAALWITAAAGVTASLLAGGGVLWWLLTRPSPEERLAAGLSAYEAGRWQEAIEQLGRYLQARPQAVEGARLRVKRAVAQIQLLATGRQWEEYLRVCREVLPQLPLQAADEPDVSRLADLVLGSVETLTDEAAHGEGGPALDRAMAAWRLTAGLPLNEAQNERRLAVEQKLLNFRRQFSRQQALRQTLDKLKQGVGKADSPFALRQALLQQFPELAASPELVAALQEVAAGMAERVAFKKVSLPQPAKAPLPLATVTLSAGGAGGTPDGVSVVFCESLGTLYGLQSATGRLAWRRYVGSANLAAVPWPGTADGTAGERTAELVLWDAAAGAVVRLRTADNQTVWAKAIDGPAFRPVRWKESWLVAQPAGRMLLLAHQDGTCQGAFEFPQPLACEPAVDIQRARAYVLGEDSHLYVVDLKARRCAQSLYLGHVPGAASWPPVLLSDGHLLVAAEWGRRLHHFQIGQQGLSPRGEQRLEAELTDAPTAVGKTLWLATRAGVDRYLMDDQNPQQLVPAGRWRLAEQAAPTTIALAGDGVWLAATGLLLITPSQPGAGPSPELQARPTEPKDGTILALFPLQPEGIVALRDQPEGHGVEAVAVDGAGQLRWRTRLAVPWACAPVLDEQGATLRAADVSGRVLRVSVASLKGEMTQEAAGMLVEGGLPAGAGVLGFEEGVWVAGWGRTLVAYDEGKASRTQLELPAPLAYRPLRSGSHVVALLERGAIWLGDPSTLREVASVHIDAGGVQHLPWATAAVVDSTRLTLGTVNGRWWQCSWSPGEPARLEAALLGAPPAWAEPRPHWGPVAVDGRLIAAGDDDLICTDPQHQQKWRYQLSGRQPVGVAAAKERLWVAFADGSVVELDGKNGKQHTAWHARQPLAFGPIQTSRGFVLATMDGSLLLWQRSEKQ